VTEGSFAVYAAQDDKLLIVRVELGKRAIKKRAVFFSPGKKESGIISDPAQQS
jgi:hypothetical protein